MTYASNETSVESGQPVEVYQITAGSTVYYYTSAESDVELASQTYTAIAGLTRGKNEEGPDRRDRDFTLEVPTANPIARLFIGTLPGYRVRLRVSRFHRGDTPTPEVVQVFDGYIQSARFKENAKVAILTGRTAIASIGRQIPRLTYQSACNHVLFHETTCKVDDTSPLYRASVLSVASMVGNVLTVSAGISGTYVDGWMTSGFVEAVGGSDFRLILNHVGDTLELLTPFPTAPISVNVFAGCAHDLDACHDKFDNAPNYGGFPFVPTENIFNEGIV